MPKNYKINGSLGLLATCLGHMYLHIVKFHRMPVSNFDIDMDIK